MWNFIEILLRHLQEDPAPGSSHDYSRMVKMEITDNTESSSESGTGKLSVIITTTRYDANLYT